MAENVGPANLSLKIKENLKKKIYFQIFQPFTAQFSAKLWTLTFLGSISCMLMDSQNNTDCSLIKTKLRVLLNISPQASHSNCPKPPASTGCVFEGPASTPERRLGPADHAQHKAAQTGMSQWAALPKEALPYQAPYTWHITASPPHRRLGLKTQAGSFWLKIHLSVYYDLCMFQWARNEKERKGEQLH